jgi:nicotinamidase-related amidase
VLLLIDHQVGLMQLIDDMPPELAKSNVVGMAKTAKTLGIPALLTTSRDWGRTGLSSRSSRRSSPTSRSSVVPA